MHYGKKASQRRQCDALGNVLLGNLVSWPSYGCYFDRYHLPKHIMVTVLPNGSGLFQQDNAPCHTAKIVQVWFEHHDREFKVLTWSPNSPDLNLIEHLWDVLDKQVRSMEAPPHNLQDLKDLLLMSWCQIPQHTFRGLVESMPCKKQLRKVETRREHKQTCSAYFAEAAQLVERTPLRDLAVPHVHRTINLSQSYVREV
ncbi:hypothetical protein PGIGA_G00072870 [Pangasianodon gigas]|uniref:Uncharacterized protein n=1 Tax=Pangasianodon gigas TaxID=30993 RepID=A0ACC5X7U4_PANGG|nr:hypothetical protein [Pangasianodon gigas]